MRPVFAPLAEISFKRKMIICKDILSGWENVSSKE